jgi:hypothetical protein
MRRHLKSDLRAFFAVSAFVFLLVITAAAQRSTSPPSNANGPFADSIERRRRETDLRSLRQAPLERNTENRLSPETVKQINEDLKRIQIIRFGLIKDIKENKVFQCKRLAEESAEIRKRADRLKNSLALFEQKSADRTLESVAFDKEQIQNAVFNLCLEISRFIESPLFKSPGGYNVRQAIDAGRTLDTVISLSNNIKNSAEKLRKTDSKSNRKASRPSL